jgi:hypothetical protein
VATSSKYMSGLFSGGGGGGGSASSSGSVASADKYVLPVGDGDIFIVSILCSILSQLLVVVDDSELYESSSNNTSEREKAISLRQLRRMVRYLKPLLYNRIWDPSSSSSSLKASVKNQQENESFMISCCGKVLRDLYDRSSRRPFISQQAWLVSAAESGRALAEVQGSTPRGCKLLHSMPYALLFVERLKLFKQFIDTDKVTYLLCLVVVEFPHSFFIYFNFFHAK